MLSRDRAVREQPDLLDHVTHRQPQLVGLLRRDVAARDGDPPGGRLDEPVDHAQRRRLAAARRADQDGDLAFAHDEVQGPNRGGALAGKDLAHTLEFDHGRWVSKHRVPLSEPRDLAREAVVARHGTEGRGSRSRVRSPAAAGVHGDQSLDARPLHPRDERHRRCPGERRGEGCGARGRRRDPHLDAHAKPLSVVVSSLFACSCSSEVWARSERLRRRDQKLFSPGGSRDRTLLA